jgi:hypothetical protein
MNAFAVLPALAALTTICRTVSRSARKSEAQKYVVVLVNRAAQCGFPT